MNCYSESETGLWHVFTRASRYPRGSMVSAGVMREAAERRRFPWSERHLQCVWFDAALRPEQLPLAKGEWVVVENPGVWNVEEGPDFLGAVIRIEPERRKVVGDVEIHVHPVDWQLHGHDRDPRYANVRIHVTYFSGAGGPPGVLHVALGPVLAQRPEWNLECVDVTAYPWAVRGTMPPCATVLMRWDADRIGQLLDSAGEERLRRKAARIMVEIEAHGAEQAFYTEVLSALGYKHNKAVCRRLAQAAPIHLLREASGGQARRAVALLTGTAGLLPLEDRARWDHETRQWVRSLWDEWWRLRDAFENVQIPRAAWRLAGIRPANHPLRRVIAAALFFVEMPEPAEYWRRVAKERPTDVCELFVMRWLKLRDSYLSRRWTLGGKLLEQEAALVGRDRAEAIAINVLVPFLAATEGDGGLVGHLLKALPATEENRIIRQTAHTLFGPDHPPSLYRSGVRRQGLLQIFHDYCLNDRSRCEACPLPKLLSCS